MSSSTEGALVWIGAGIANEPLIDVSEFTKCFLIDANLSFCEELERKFEQSEMVSVANKIVYGEKQPSQLLITNLQELSSTSAFAKIKEHYPGLRVLQKEHVTSIAITDYLESLNLEKHSGNVLIIDVFAGSLSLLNELLQSAFSTLFDRIIVLQSELLYFEDSCPPEEIQTKVKDNGYVLGSQYRLEGTVYYQEFVINPLFDRYKALDSIVKELKQKLVDSEREVEAKNHEIANGASELASYVNIVEELEHKSKVLTAECSCASKKVETLERNLSDSNSQITSLTQQLENETRANSDKASLLYELKEQLEQIKDKNTTSSKVNEEKTLAFATSQNQLENAQAQLKQLTEEFDRLKLQKRGDTEKQLELEEALADKTKWLSEHEKWNSSLQQESEKHKYEIEQLHAKLALEKENLVKLESVELNLQEQVFRNEKLHLELEKFEAQLKLLSQFIKV